jgi:hypothetical protein
MQLYFFKKKLRGNKSIKLKGKKYTNSLDSVYEPIKPTNQLMNSIGFNNSFIIFLTQI